MLVISLLWFHIFYALLVQIKLYHSHVFRLDIQVHFITLSYLAISYIYILDIQVNFIELLDYITNTQVNLLLLIIILYFMNIAVSSKIFCRSMYPLYTEGQFYWFHLAGIDKGLRKAFVSPNYARMTKRIYRIPLKVSITAFLGLLYIPICSTYKNTMYFTRN